MNGQDPGSLDQLRDIVEPAAVSWWPLAPGWWILLGLAALALLFWAVRAIREWNSNAYRRVALDELQSVKSDSAVLEVLKRTAICASSRSDVGSLTGRAWSQWLSNTCSLTMSEVVLERIAEGAYRNGSALTPELTEFARQWVARHSIRPGTEE